jgi:MoaA/NifB/PqqE/SkfB family radical SAM enzyme
MKNSKIHKVKHLIDLYLAWRKNGSYKPLQVELLISSKCNSRCLMCNVWKLANEKPEPIMQELSTNEWLNLLKELSEMGTEGIFISGGEPTLRNDLIKIIKFAKEKEFYHVDLVTNGSLITKSLVRDLIKSGIDQISFSIDGPIPKIHDEIRGVNGSWKKVIKSIKLVDEARRKTGSKKPKINVAYIVSRKSYRYIEKMIDLKLDLGFDTINFQPIISKVSRAEEFFLGDEDIKKLQQSLHNIEKKIQEHNLPKESMLPLEVICTKKENVLGGEYTSAFNEKILCFAPWLMTTIDPFGNVYPCCFACTFQNLSDDLRNIFWGNEDLCLGNIRERSFKEIWDGKNYRKLREEFKNPPNYKMCNWCYYRSLSSMDVLLTAIFKDRSLLFDFISKKN